MHEWRFARNEHRYGVSVCVHVCASRVSRRAFRKHWRSVYIAQIGRGSTAIRGYIPFIITVWSTAGKREGTRSLTRSKLGREQRESRSSSRCQANMRVSTSRAPISMHFGKTHTFINPFVHRDLFSILEKKLKKYKLFKQCTIISIIFSDCSSNKMTTLISQLVV